MAKKRIYYSLDLFKYLSAFLVVAVHVYPFVNLSEVFNTYFLADVCRIAVPFYFVCSGFFFFKKRNPLNERNLGRYEVRIGILYLIWTILYLPLIIYNGVLSDDILLYVVEWVRDFFFAGSYYHLWFLPALMAGMGLVWFLLRRYGLNRTVSIVFVLYFIGWLINMFGPLWQTVPLVNLVYNFYIACFDTARNGVFFAPIFLMIGYLLANNIRPNRTVSLAGAILSWILLILEVWIYGTFEFLQDLSSMFLMLVPLLYFLVSFLITLRLRPAKIYEKLRKESTLIYTSHIYFVVVLFILMPNANFWVYVLTLLLSGAFAYGVVYLSKTFKWLKWLY